MGCGITDIDLRIPVGKVVYWIVKVVNASFSAPSPRPPSPTPPNVSEVSSSWRCISQSLSITDFDLGIPMGGL